MCFATPTGLALRRVGRAQANPLIGQQEEARQSLSIARDIFLEHPEDDPRLKWPHERKVKGLAELFQQD